MKKKIFFAHMVLCSVTLVGCGGGGGGSSESSAQNLTPIAQEPIVPSQPSSALTPQDKVEATQIAQFFLNTITNESLNTGLIDRLLFAAQHTATTCPSAVMITSAELADVQSSTHLSHIFSPCSLAYPRGEHFSIQSGQIEHQLIKQPTDANISQDQFFNFNNVILSIEGKTFTVNGLVSHSILKNDDVIVFSHQLKIAPQANNEFIFQNFASTLKKTSTGSSQHVQGEMKVLGPKSYHVKFSTPSAWQTLNGNTYPTAGELNVQYANDASRFLTLRAQPNSSSALYHLEAAQHILFNQVSRPWSEIMISPAQYKFN